MTTVEQSTEEQTPRLWVSRVLRRADGALRGRILVPSFVAGLLLAASVPPWGLWILAFPGTGLLWWRLGGLRARTRTWAGWVAGIGLFAPGLWWSLQFNVYGGMVLMAVEALAIALAAGVSPSRGGRLLVLGGAAVLTEALRSIWPFGGLPLGGVALGQAASPLAGADRLGGPLLLVGLVWLGGAGAAMVVTGIYKKVGGRSASVSGRSAAVAGRSASVDGRSVSVSGRSAAVAGRSASVDGRRMILAGFAAVVVTVAVCIAGATASNGGLPIGRIRVAAVQGGGRRGLSQSQVDPSVVYDAQVAATEGLISSIATSRSRAGAHVSLILWPEDTVSLGENLSADPPVESQLAGLARSARTTLVVGVTEDEPHRRYRNEMIAFAPSGAVVAHYEKVHRVPFGEYVPYRGFFSHLANLSGVPRDAVPGHSDGVLHTPAGRLGTMISYEVFFAERGRTATRGGATLLIVPTNTSSYSTSQVPSQEIAADRLQAIAEGRDLVQAAPTGYSTVVDNRGVLLQRSPLARRDVLVADVSLRRGDTIYERFGDLPVLVAAAVLVVVGWFLGLSSEDPEKVAINRAHLERRRGRDAAALERGRANRRPRWSVADPGPPIDRDP